MASELGGLGVADYLTLELVHEAEAATKVFGLSVGSETRFVPLYGRDGRPFHPRDNARPLEEPTGPAVHASSDAVYWWALWASPALLAGWERAVLLLRYHRCPQTGGELEPRTSCW